MHCRIIAAVLLLLLQLSQPLFADDQQLITRSARAYLSLTDISNNASGGAPVLSADGRFAVYSARDPVVPGDVEENSDIFFHDRSTGRVTLVSHAFDDPEQVANNNSTEPIVSADGSTVVFKSRATDLIDGFSGSTVDNLFAWDRDSNTVILISRSAAGPLQGADSSTARYSVSADGAFIVFSTSATNLTSTPDANSALDVFLWSRDTGELTLISHALGAPEITANSFSSAPKISDDGAFVVFNSAATNLTPFADNNGVFDIFLWQASDNSVTLVSQALGGGAGNRESATAEISGDGSTVAFLSFSTDLLPITDTNNRIDLFVWDRASGTLKLISQAIDVADTTGNDAVTGVPRLSADGQFVTFQSQASNLVSATDVNGVSDIFQWSQASDVITLISSPDGGANASNGRSTDVRASEDGTMVAFFSTGTDLLPGPDNNGGEGDLFVWSRLDNSLQLASRSASKPNANSEGLVDNSSLGISQDGRHVYFRHFGSELVPSALEGGLLAYDTSVGAVRLLSRAPLQMELLISSPESNELESISTDGRFVVFESRDHALVEGIQALDQRQTFLWDRQTGDMILVSHAWTDPLLASDRSTTGSQISADGSTVFFISSASDIVDGLVGPFRNNLYAWDRATGTTRLITRSAVNASSGADGNTTSFAVSEDGGVVAFTNPADDLVSGTDTNGRNDVFVWSRSTDTVQLASRSTAGAAIAANEESSDPRISADGNWITFGSRASDLVAGFTNPSSFSVENIFLLDLAGGDMQLVSRASTSPTEGGDLNCSEHQISGDGSAVAFLCAATNLIDGYMAPALLRQAFHFQRSTGEVRLVSAIAGSTTAAGNDRVDEILVSGDGNQVIFESLATDLVSGQVDTNAGTDVFAWNRSSGTTELVSRATAGPNTTGDRLSSLRSADASGQRIAFSSFSTDLLVDFLGQGHEEIYLRDRTTGATRLATHSKAGANAAPITYSGSQGILSADGSWLAFRSFGWEHTDGVDEDESSDIYIFSVDGPTDADLSVALQSNLQPLPPGETVGVNLEVQNLSPRPAHHVYLVAQIPAAVEFLGAGGDGWDCLQDDLQLSCRHGLLAGGETSNLPLTLITPPDAGPLGFVAKVLWPGIDLDQGNNLLNAVLEVASDDWGDAPDPNYPTLAASDGASHGFSPLFLGSLIDVDLDGQPTADANGDGIDGSVDEDGVMFAALVLGQSATIDVTASGAGILDAWVDWNGNGSWDDAGEKIFDGQALTAGVNNLSVSVPVNAIVGQTFSRFRLSTAGVAAPTGRADDGEVEDYAVTLESIGLTASLSASPTEVPEVGAPVTFSVAIANIGTAPMELSALTDDQVGDLNGVGTCALPQTVVADGVYLCEYVIDLGGDVGSSETHTLSAAGTSVDFALQSQDSATVTFFDSMAPDFLGFERDGDGSALNDCDALRRRPGSLQAVFGETLLTGPGGADDVASYRLLTTGDDLSFETEGCGITATSDVEVPFEVLYQLGVPMGDASTASLLPVQPLADGLYRLRICDGLQDVGANALPGGDFGLDFRVDDGNLLANGHFDCTIDGWPQDPPSGEIQYAAEDADGSSLSGSMQFASAREVSFGVGPCLEVDGGVRLQLSIALRLDAPPETSVALARGCGFYLNPGCNGLLSQPFINEMLTDTELQFVHREDAFNVPNSSQSMRCGLLVEAEEAGFDLFFDSAQLRLEGIFGDGFESGDTSSWSTSTP